MRKRRKNNDKELAPVFHIFCEGEKTEPYYFRGYIEKFFPGNRRIRVEKTNKNTPKQLVEEAVKSKNDKNFPEGDIFWVVYDRENAAKYSDTLHLEAYQLAKANVVNIALSNVCFELWILLHFEMSTASYSSCDDLIKNSALRKEHIKNYDKGDKKIFDEIFDRIDDAKSNAISMNEGIEKTADHSWKKPYQLNPFSDVYKLLDAIQDFGK